VPKPYVGYTWVTSLVLDLANANPLRPAGTKVSFQWLRNDRPIPGAAGTKYRTTAADNKKGRAAESDVVA
jgi:hypothetical protein